MSAAKKPTRVFRELGDLLDEHGIEPRGVVHVGANRGQEVPAYRRAGFETIRLVEPIPGLAASLPADCEVVPKAVSIHRGTATLYVPAFDEAASLLRPTGRRVVRELTARTVPLRDVQDGCNVLVVDAQGSELDVLRSGDLEALDMLVVEVFPTERYVGAAVREEVLGFLGAAGWRLVREFPHRVATVSDCVFVR